MSAKIASLPDRGWHPLGAGGAYNDAGLWLRTTETADGKRVSLTKNEPRIQDEFDVVEF